MPLNHSTDSTKIRPEFSPRLRSATSTLIAVNYPNPQKSHLQIPIRTRIATPIQSPNPLPNNHLPPEIHPHSRSSPISPFQQAPSPNSLHPLHLQYIKVLNPLNFPTSYSRILLTCMQFQKRLPGQFPPKLPVAFHKS